MTPDVAYGTTRRDVLEHNAGWLEAALTSLRAARPATSREAPGELAGTVR